MTVAVKRALILEPVAQRALVKWHVALEQLEVEWGEEAITKGISDGLVSDNAWISLRHRLESSSWFCYQRHRSPDNDHLPSLGLSSRFQFLHDGATQALSHSPCDIFAIQGDCEGQPRGPGDNHVMPAKVREPEKQLLVLVNAARIVCDDHRLPHFLTPKGSRSDLYVLSLRLHLLETMMY